MEVQGDTRVGLVSQVVLQDAVQCAALSRQDVAGGLQLLGFVDGQGQTTCLILRLLQYLDA